MSTIYQADQYYIPFRIEQAEKVIRPTDVDGVRIAIGGVIQAWPDGELLFDGGENWMFLLQSGKSQHMSGNVPCQVELKKGEYRQHSPVFNVNVEKSILRGKW